MRSGPAGPARPYLIRSISRSRYLSALRLVLSFPLDRPVGAPRWSLDRHFRHFEGWRMDTGMLCRTAGDRRIWYAETTSPIDFPKNRKKKRSVYTDGKLLTYVVTGKFNTMRFMQIYVLPLIVKVTLRKKMTQKRNFLVKFIRIPIEIPVENQNSDWYNWNLLVRSFSTRHLSQYKFVLTLWHISYMHLVSHCELKH